MAYCWICEEGAWSDAVLRQRLTVLVDTGMDQKRAVSTGSTNTLPLSLSLSLASYWKRATKGKLKGGVGSAGRCISDGSVAHRQARYRDPMYIDSTNSIQAESETNQQNSSLPEADADRLALFHT